MNLVIIVSDTLRYDYLGAYGNPWIHTPNLDALAKESALFLDAYAEALPTLPARRVIMTGRRCFPFSYRPQASDLVQTYGWHPLFDEDVTLAERLNARGYCTAFVNDVYHMMKPGKNFTRGFEQWFFLRGQEADPYAPLDRARVADLIARVPNGKAISDTAWVIRHLNLRKDWKSEEDTIVARTMTQAAKWVKEYSLKRPFYLHVEVFDPHEPWDPPREYAERYEPDYGDSLDGVWCPGSVSDLTPRQVTNIKAAYAGEVSLVDRWTGHLLDALRETGRLNDTLLVFTSDHGCMMGEQGQIHKGMDRLRAQCTRLPLLIRHPRGDRAGLRVKGFCQHQDIMPTVLALLGEEAPERVTGRNVWPAGDTTPDAPDYVVSAFGTHACLRTRRWNLIRPWTLQGARASLSNPRAELYDLEADPQELTDVIARHPGVAKELDRMLEDHIRRFAPLTDGSFQRKAEADSRLSFSALPRLDGYV